MTFTVADVCRVFLLSFCRIYCVCFFLQGMLSARICKSLDDGIPLKTNECVCVNVNAVEMLRASDRTDRVFPLWCVCASVRTFAGAAAVSAGAPETASVRCSLERCKQPLSQPHTFTPVSLSADAVLTSALLFLFLVFALRGG